MDRGRVKETGAQSPHRADRIKWWMVAYMFAVHCGAVWGLVSLIRDFSWATLGNRFECKLDNVAMNDMCAKSLNDYFPILFFLSLLFL